MNASEAGASSILVLLHLSLLLLRIFSPPPSFATPALSEWVRWWRSLPPCIVGSVRVSPHCCKYGVSVQFWTVLTLFAHKSIRANITHVFVSIAVGLGALHSPGGCLIFVWSCVEEVCAGLQRICVLEAGVDTCCPLQGGETHWSSSGACLF